MRSRIGNRKSTTIACIKRYWRGTLAGGTLLAMLAVSGGPVPALDFNEPLNSFSTGIGQENEHIGAKNRANFSSDNHGSVLIGANLYLDSSSGGEELKIALEHDSPYNTSLAGAAIHMPGHHQLRQGGIDFYARPPLDRPVAANEPFPNFPDSPSMSILADGNVEMKGDLQVNASSRPSGDLYARGQIVPEKGEKGDKGDKGDRGPDGNPGHDGTPGRDGARGPNGRAGVTTVAICGQFPGGCSCLLPGRLVVEVQAQTGTSGCEVSASTGSCRLSFSDIGLQGAKCCVCTAQ